LVTPGVSSGKLPIADSEEYAIHDDEGFGSYSLGEYAGIERGGSRDGG